MIGKYELWIEIKKKTIDNRIGVEGAKMISESLTKNTALAELDLVGLYLFSDAGGFSMMENDNGQGTKLELTEQRSWVNRCWLILL